MNKLALIALAAITLSGCGITISDKDIQSLSDKLNKCKDIQLAAYVTARPNGYIQVNCIEERQ